MHLNEGVFFFFFFFSSLRMMTQMLEALLNISEWAGTSCSHLIELWRPLIPVHKTAWHTPELPLSHTRSSLRPCALMANHFEKQRWSFHFAFVQNEVTAWRQNWTPKSEILTSRKKKYWQSWTFLVFTLACFWQGEFKTVLPREVASLSVSEGWEDIQEERNKNCPIFYTCLRIFSSRYYWDTRCKKSWVFSVLCFSIFRVLPRAVMATPLPHWWP